MYPIYIDIYWMKETSFQLNNARIYVNCICVQDKKKINSPGYSSLREPVRLQVLQGTSAPDYDFSMATIYLHIT